MEEKVEYPVYRKYINNRSFFKIDSEERFIELQIVFKTYNITTHEATTLPDRNYIYDMVYNYVPYWVEIEESEYAEKVAWCKDNLTLK